jgi:hypothetical protein
MTASVRSGGESADIDACLKFARDRIDHPIVAA